jgi:4-hydroxy-tetrahydrodipicolinate synthase
VTASQCKTGQRVLWKAKNYITGVKRVFKFLGAIPPIVTPFNKDYSIDEKGLRELVRFCIDSELHSIVVGGSTGEYTYMTLEERKKIIEVAVDEAGDKMPIIAGTGCHSTRQTIELTAYAKNVGAAATLIITPHYLVPTEEGVINHYQSIAQSVDLPIILYSYPAATGVYISDDMLLRLSKEKNIVGIKNTSSMEHTNLLIKAMQNQNEFSVLTGWETLFLPTLACGGAGGICVSASVVPKMFVELHDAIVNKNDVKKAAGLHNKMVPLFKALFKEPNPGPVKAALELMGLPAGPTRLPLLPISEGLKNELSSILKELER